MSDQIHEKVGEKVAKRVTDDAREATKKALEGVREDLKGRGFRAIDVDPYIRKGAREAADKHTT